MLSFDAVMDGLFLLANPIEVVFGTMGREKAVWETHFSVCTRLCRNGGNVKKDVVGV